MQCTQLRLAIDIWTLRRLVKHVDAVHVARYSDHWPLDPVVIVIPTNVGWRGDGCNVMGRGLARQAALKYPNLPRLYGAWCQSMGEQPYYYEEGQLYCIPSKPLNSDNPALSWQGRGDVALIKQGIEGLRARLNEYPFDEGLILVPLIGAGNAGISRKVSRKLIEDALGEFLNVVRVEPYVRQ